MTTGFTTFGQAYHYFENRIPLSQDSIATLYTFLTIQNNGNGVARVRYTDPKTNQSTVAEVNLLDSAATGPDGEEHFLVPDGDFIPIEGNERSGIRQPRFSFKRQSENGETFYVPAGISWRAKGGDWQPSDLVLSEEKSIDQLEANELLISGFYKPSEDFYLFLYGPKAYARSPEKRKEKIHLIVVANTMDTTVAASSLIDIGNMISTFSQLAADLNMDILITKIMDLNLTKTAVNRALAGLKPAPSDIVVFFYSGHGFRYANDVSNYPRILLRTNPIADANKNNLSFEEIFNTLIKKKARVTLAISDCCNGAIDESVPFGPSQIITRSRRNQSAPGLNMAVCQRLFFPPKPLAILIGSADKNQLAAGNPRLGGYFTNTFTTELRTKLYGIANDATWRSILDNTKKLASWKSLAALCNESRCIQSARIAGNM